MDFNYLIDLFLHLDVHLGAFMQQYGTAVYVLLFFVVFCETGLVVAPFLPGDSLIFAAGALTATGIMEWYALPLFIIAAVGGNLLNYRIGRGCSDKLEQNGKLRFVKQEYLEQAQKFFCEYGGSAIIVTRFMPILRTFTPFAAGIGKMPYRHFLTYNGIGGVCWASLFFLMGFFFGNLPIIKTHFSMIVVGIVVVSVIPAFVVYLKKRRKEKNGG